MRTPSRHPTGNLTALNPPYPQNRAEFAQWFRNEETCMAYLSAIRWPDGFSCPKCSGQEAWEVKVGLRRCKTCRTRVSATAGTLLHRTRKPMHDWLEGLWHICGQKRGGSAIDLQNAMGFGSYHTAWEWLHRMRLAMVMPGRSLLSGEVEVDETFIGGLKHGRRGRAAAGKTIVLIASEIRGLAHGRIRLQVVSDAKAPTLEAAVSALVERGSNVVTDGWAGYHNLSALGFRHTVSRPSTNVGEQLLPHVDRIASLLKRWLLGTHQGAVGHHRLQSYLDEFVFRFNRRRADSRGLLFHRLLVQVLQNGPTKRDQL